MSVPTTAAMSAATGTAEVRGAAGTATAAVTVDRGAAAATKARLHAEGATQTAADTTMRPRRAAGQLTGAATTIAAATVAGALSSCMPVHVAMRTTMRMHLMQTCDAVLNPAEPKQQHVGEEGIGAVATEVEAATSASQPTAAVVKADMAGL